MNRCPYFQFCDDFYMDDKNTRKGLSCLDKSQNSPVSILILTLNEADNISRCLDAISWCNDIVVLDSGSSDDTLKLASDAGCRVFNRPFDNFASQRNFALETVNFRHEWVLHLDADEVVSSELCEEIGVVVEKPGLDAYRIPSKTMFQQRWLRYSGMYPAYQVRLTRLPNFRFRQVGHGQKEDLDASRIGTLENSYQHYSFSKGMREWFEKHNRYSSDEAEETIRQLQRGRVDWAGLVSGESSRRRQALKGFSYRLPFRPLLRFLYMYCFRFGFLDGRPGFSYCCLLAFYEFMISVKVKEMIQDKGASR